MACLSVCPSHTRARTCEVGERSEVVIIDHITQPRTHTHTTLTTYCPAVLVLVVKDMQREQASDGLQAPAHERREHLKTRSRTLLLMMKERGG